MELRGECGGKNSRESVGYIHEREVLMWAGQTMGKTLLRWLRGGSIVLRGTVVGDTRTPTCKQRASGGG